MQNTDIFINPRQSVTFSNSIFHLENYCQTSVLLLYKGATLVDNRAHGLYTLGQQDPQPVGWYSTP